MGGQGAEPIEAKKIASTFYLSNPSLFPNPICCSSYVSTTFKGVQSGLTNLSATLVPRAPTGFLPTSLF